MFYKNKKGFTLVELLVVISIIGILSSFAIVSLNTARTKARDALRKGDMAQLRTALSLYYDENESYPVCDGLNWNPAWGSGDDPMGSAPAAGAACYNNVLGPALSSGARPVMPEMPNDPKNPTNDPAVSTQFLYRYISDETGSQYAVVYYLEEEPGVAQIIRGY